MQEKHSSISWLLCRTLRCSSCFFGSHYDQGAFDERNDISHMLVHIGADCSIPTFSLTELV